MARRLPQMPTNGNRAASCLISPQDGAQRRAVAAFDLERKCDQIVTAGIYRTQVERLDDVDSGASERLMVDQLFCGDLIHRGKVQSEQLYAPLLQPVRNVTRDGRDLLRENAR